MKELTIKYVGYGMGFYPTEDVDEVVAELKQNVDDLQTKLEVADKSSTNLVHQLAEQRIQIAELEKQLKGIPVWHNVSDCKPPEDTRVLVLVDVLRKGVKFIQIDTYTRKDWLAPTRVPRFKTYGEYVTRWMPLPTEP